VGEAALWAGFAASTLIIGAWLGAAFDASPRTIGLVMGFGAGALIASVSFELTQDAFERGGTAPLTLGLAAGALVFYVGDLLVDRMGGARRKAISGPSADGQPLALLLGAGLDAIPESLIIGLTLVGGGSIEVAFLVSVAVSNLPEGYASAAEQRRQGVPASRIVPRWLVIVALSAICGAIGYAVFDDLGQTAVAFTKAFGAGALLVMVLDTMAPEAYREAGPTTGLIAVVGFAFAFLLGEVA
jgi:ZIP family zinc transporter